ncbi:MAG TPA: NADH-quinone oxidoreductase subunit A [Candidatus Megaira endosymbiont of Nemacystus decipiens]|nr:NADH-quinone oxidoreductase subunit A [Candidatus Megaera endosymbiont of Nemacystus decipiens]
MQINTAIALQYFPIALFLAVAVILSLICITLPWVFASRLPSKNKLSSYECGFDAFNDARGRFNIRFYLVAILFIIFDLEVAFLIPWAINLKSIGQFGFWSMMIFLLVLTIGFIYEWRKGALEWE